MFTINVSCVRVCVCRYVHVLVQKMAVNVDLGFILSLVDFFSLNGSDPLFQVRIIYTVTHAVRSIKECTPLYMLYQEYNYVLQALNCVHFFY